jgi:hypothetical protein
MKMSKGLAFLIPRGKQSWDGRLTAMKLIVNQKIG